MQRAVERVDRISIDCQRLVNDLAPAAFSQLEAALGMTLSDIVRGAVCGVCRSRVMASGVAVRRLCSGRS